MNTEKWDKRYMDLAGYIAQWSNNQGRKFGAVIVGPDEEIRSTGFNGFPRGTDDTVPERNNKEDGTKYLWSLCAERNAIANAARVGVSVKGCTMYVNDMFCCAECTKMIIQSGISRLVCVEPDFNQPKYGPTFPICLEMLKEAGVLIKYMK